MTVASKVKQTLATLKGVESTLRIYSLQSRNDDEKNTFRSALQITESITKDIEDRLKTLELQEPQYKGN